ncbi:ProQ/FINO family protein [Providencia rettgeri]|uniref:ProQ/FINO family protein n=1 Tax=Providencia rettgeri TaxID=587 RepID=UPI0018C7A7AF|nr:ProQ/FINO family protein [Providencia rettgeri]ELT5688301.1 conjugal transfer protein [Providencia rettgeri]MBG5925441.1 conjugal transfer protein [Providencia rettgeri]MBS0861637.1 conjugal transfer protein [Providencia rettgeri]MBS0875512.1 conjugal transfer protein [Providencia rettgeri]MBS0922693.1 conjugal transfer protein [Providencia rettgeri]
MERKTLTLKRPTTENVAESTEPVIQRRRKQMVINTQRKPNKHPKKTATQPPKKLIPSPAKKKDAVVIPLEKKVIPPTPPKQHLPLAEAIATLSEHWPHLFPDGQLRPMAVGTREALFADKKARELPISTKKLKRSLAAISHSVKYRTTIMPGAVRYDKDGQPQGHVTDSDMIDTIKRIQKLAKRHSLIA